jgi:hypothetical protein
MRSRLEAMSATTQGCPRRPRRDRAWRPALSSNTIGIFHVDVTLRYRRCRAPLTGPGSTRHLGDYRINRPGRRTSGVRGVTGLQLLGWLQQAAAQVL